MKIAVIGSIYGDIEATYEKLAGQKIEWVLSTGNFGVWPDPVRADRASRQNGTGDFLKYLAGQKNIPIPTLMVAGKHEDHWWINQMVKRGNGELIPNLHFLVSGNHTFIDGSDGTTVRIVGLGGTFSPSNNGLGHYTEREIQRACAAGQMDILLSHEAPDGEVFDSIVSTAKGLNKVAFATNPRLLCHGKYAKSLEYRTKQTGTVAACVGKHDYKVLFVEPDSIYLPPKD